MRHYSMQWWRKFVNYVLKIYLILVVAKGITPVQCKKKLCNVLA